MGCEFSDKIRKYKRFLVKRQYKKLSKEHQKKFTKYYGLINNIPESKLYSVYYHIKRVLKTKEYNK